ncbi:MAG: hypothetical protein ABWZ80_03510 [Beijerinckiaceae bacterium]
MRRMIATLIAGGSLIAAATAQETPKADTFESWPALVNPFPSTGGNGVMIDGYDPVVKGDRCATNFTATTPDGIVYRNVVEFRATPIQGGILCDDGQWRAADGSASGTTPFRIFIKSGIVRRAPE